MITALLFGGVCYTAGIVTGVLLSEKGVVTSGDIRDCGKKMASGARILVAKVRDECTTTIKTETMPLPPQP